MADEKKKPGRPAGTVESLEALARDDAKENLKLSKKLKDILRANIPYWEESIEELKKQRNPEARRELREVENHLADLQERLMKMVSPVAKVAAQTTKIEDEGVSEDLRAKAFLDELKGEAV